MNISAKAYVIALSSSSLRPGIGMFLLPTVVPLERGKAQLFT